nr:histidine phosphatase family protein [Nocardioides daedukensis]
MIRHGVTPHTVDKRFSGGLASANPGLSDLGREQVRATAEWLQNMHLDAVIASPVRRTLESAEIIAEVLGHDLETEAGFAEMEFGDWDGMTFGEVAEKHQADLDAWLGSVDVAPPGGESMRAVQARVLAGLDRTLAAHTGRTIAVVSHVTPIKTLVSHAVQAPLDSLFRMELTPASVSVVSFHENSGRNGDERVGSLRLFNARPGDEILPPARF